MRVLNNTYNYDWKGTNELIVIDIDAHIKGSKDMDEVSIHIKNEIANEWKKSMEDLEKHVQRLVQLGAPRHIINSLLPPATCFPTNK